jgi:hypothetical protein
MLSGSASKMLGGTPRSLVVALDTSMSMRYGDRFQEAQKRALDLLKSLRPFDEAAVITFSDRPGAMHPLTTDHSALEAFVKRLPPPGYRATHLLPALRLADQILRSAATEEKTIYLLSDYQRSAATGNGDAWTLSPGTRFEPIRIGQTDIINLAVTDVTVTAPPAESDATHGIKGRIHHFGGKPAPNVRVWLEIDGRTVAAESLELAPGAEQIVTFPVAVTRSGLHSGVLNVAGDRFGPDNRRYFTVRIAPPLRVLLVADGSSTQSGADDPRVWLRFALEGRPTSLFQVDDRDLRDFRADTLASYAAVVLMNVDTLSQPQTRALSSYVKGGGGLLLAPADGVEREAFNRSWAAVTPAFLRRKAVGGEGTRLAIARPQQQHALVRSLMKDESAHIGAARFHGYWETEPAEAGEVILAFENGHPALLEKTVGNGRVLLFTSSLDPVWNNFPRQVMYLPMVQEVVRYVAGSRDQKAAFLIGEIAPLKVPAAGVARVTSPSGRETVLPATPAGFSYFDATDQPGVYETRSGNRAGRFSVNVSAREADFETLSAQEILDRVTVSEQSQSSADVRWASMLKIQREASQQYWWWLLLLVLVLGFFEIYLANRTYR